MVNCIKGLVCKSHKAVVLMLDISTGVSAAVNMCLQLTKSRWFVIREESRPYYSNFLPSLVRIHEKQVYRQELGVLGSRKGFEAINNSKALAVLPLKRRVDGFTFVVRLVTVQVFLLHMTSPP